jgi:hypothetical protein
VPGRTNLHARRAVVAVVLAVLSACGWTQQGFDGGSTQNNPFESAIGPANVSTLVRSWSKPELDNGGYYGVLVRSGRIFTSDGDRGVHAYDERTGVALWSVAPAPAAPGASAYLGALVVVASPAGDVVLAGERHIGLRSGGGFWGAVRALRASDGHELWSTPIGATLGARLVAGRLFVPVQQNHDGVAFDGTIVLDPATGAEQFRLPGLRVLAGDDDVVVGSVGLDLVAAVPTAGCGAPACLPVWSASMPQVTYGRIAVAGHQAYVSTATGFAVFPTTACAASCAARWRVAGSFGYLAVSGSRVFLSSDYLFGGNIGRLWVFDAAGCGASTCAPLWSSAVDRYLDDPVVAGGLVYISARGNPTEAYPVAGCGAATCAPVWSTSDAFGTPVSPVIVNGRVFLGGPFLQTYVLP